MENITAIESSSNMTRGGASYTAAVAGIVAATSVVGLATVASVAS